MQINVHTCIITGIAKQKSFKIKFSKYAKVLCFESQQQHNHNSLTNNKSKKEFRKIIVPEFEDSFAIEQIESHPMKQKCCQ